jgi:hypothetical protein
MALLPDMAPYSEANGSDFAELGFGKKVRVSLVRKRSDWRHFFLNTFPRFRHADDGLQLEGFLRYEDRISEKVSRIVYLNYDKPQDDLIVISCDAIGSAGLPSCSVTAPYLRGFQAEYYFGAEHLVEWSRINRQVIDLLDRFRHDGKP